MEQEKSLEKLSRLALNRENRAKEDPGQRLPVILPGFLLNLCNTTPEAVQVIGEFDIWFLNGPLAWTILDIKKKCI